MNALGRIHPPVQAHQESKGCGCVRELGEFAGCGASGDGSRGLLLESFDLGLDVIEVV